MTTQQLSIAEYVSSRSEHVLSGKPASGNSYLRSLPRPEPHISAQWTHPVIVAIASNRGLNARTLCKALHAAVLVGSPTHFIWAASPEAAIEPIRTAKSELSNHLEAPVVVHYGLNQLAHFTPHPEKGWNHKQLKKFNYPGHFEETPLYYAPAAYALGTAGISASTEIARRNYQSVIDRGSVQGKRVKDSQALNTATLYLGIPAYGRRLPTVTIPQDIRETLAQLPQDNQARAILDIEIEARKIANSYQAETLELPKVA